MKSMKLSFLIALIAGPVTVMADGCPNLAGTYKNGGESIQISQSKNASGALVYNVSTNGNAQTFEVGSTSKYNGALGPSDAVILCKDDKLVLKTTLAAMGGATEVEALSLNKDGDLVTEQSTNVPGMPQQLPATSKTYKRTR